MKRIYVMTCLALLLASAPAPRSLEERYRGHRRRRRRLQDSGYSLTGCWLSGHPQGSRSFTVFAPTDEAFAKLPAGTVEDLLKPENKQKLISILTYHVVAGDVMAKDVVKMTEAKTVNGKEVKITVQGGKVMVDGATSSKLTSRAATASFT